MNSKHLRIFFTILVAGIIALLYTNVFYEWIKMPVLVLPVLRWTFIVLMLINALQKPTFGKWIFIAALCSLELHLLDVEGLVPVPEGIKSASRWLTEAALIVYGFYKKSLTTWILISMVLGVELGWMFPEFSQNLKVLSHVFLRMIKTIIAPILFSTLVVGIAGHSNLKQV